MSDHDDIPPEWRERNPLMSIDGWQALDGLLQHEHGPSWNFATGDRLVDGDLEIVDEYRRRVFERDALPSAADVPPPAMREWVRDMRERSWLFAERIPEGYDLGKNWAFVPTMDRELLSSRIEMIVPHDLDDFSRFISYDTSGTTGHAVPLPYHPVTIAQHHPLCEYALQRHGVSTDWDASVTAVANVCAQQNTYIFANVFSVWNDAGFVKVNLNEADWPGGRDAARAYLADVAPKVITSDPISLAVMLEWEIDLRPDAILSTAVELGPDFADRLADHYGCPVIDWYSTSETGPIAFSTPEGDGYEIVPHDIFVEIVDDDGQPVDDGEFGEICVTGGRNPYLPMLRYRTGDFGRLSRDGIPRLTELHGRTPAFFRSSDGSPINAVDVGRAMRLWDVFVQHQFTQRTDGSCLAVVRPVAGIDVDLDRVQRGLNELFGDYEVTIEVDPGLGADGRKVEPYVSEIEPWPSMSDG